MTDVQNDEKIEGAIEKTAEGENEENDEKPAEENGVESNENHDNNENESEEDESSDEEQLGLLERPVEILEGKRDRKSTDRLALEKYATPKQDKEELDYTKGKGMKLGDIAYIRHQIDKTHAEELKTLHRILFHKQGKITMIKKNIRSFCGYPFEKDSNHCTKVENQLDRVFVGQLKSMCGYLGQEKSGDKVAIKERLITYLLNPTDIEKPIPGRKAKSEKKSKSKKKKSKPKKEVKSSEEVDEPSEPSSDESDKEEGDEKDEKKEKKKEKKAASPKKKTPKKETTKKTEKKKKTPKQPAIKLPVPKKKKDGSPKKRKAVDESEDDEPLVKKTKSEPTDAELKKVVSGILQDADLEQITMKTVVKQVYEKYPSFDLTPRKDFIKATVKEIIS